MNSAQKTVISAAILLASLFANILLAFHNQWAVIKIEYGVSGKYGLWNACDDGDTGVCSSYPVDAANVMAKIAIMGAITFGLLCFILWGAIWKPDDFHDSQKILGIGMSYKGIANFVGSLEFITNLSLTNTVYGVSLSGSTACYLTLGLGLMDMLVGVGIRTAGSGDTSPSSSSSSPSSSSPVTRIEGNVGTANPPPQQSLVVDGVTLIN